MAKRRKQSVKLSAKMIAGILALAIVILGLSGALLWRHNSNDPRRVFWDMLGSSLSTSSVTRHVTETSASGSLDQITRLSLGGQSVAQALTTVNQSTASGKDRVITETLGTAKEDFVRYRSIESSQKRQNGQPFDFSKVIDLWGKNQPSIQQPAGQFLNGNILSVVPFAPLNSAQREHVLQAMRDKNMYETDYSKTLSRKQNGRPVFIYQVSVKPSAYVAVLKVFAHELGLTQLDNIDPANYASGKAEQMEFSIDKLTHQLVSIHYNSSQRLETYSGYGEQSVVEIPTSTISVSELQSRLQSLR